MMDRILPLSILRAPSIVLWILGPVITLVAGCSDQICPDRPPAMIHRAPNGRAVAFVDRQLFANIHDWLERAERDPATSFDCLLNDFTAAFSNDVDMIFLVMNQSRSEFIERRRRDVISNFTSSQRIFETGIGTLPRSPVATVGPPGMRCYSFFGVREGLTTGPSLHELAHAWCAYLDGPPSLAVQLDAEPAGHWGFTSVGGALGGWDPQSLEDLGAGQYRVCGPSQLESFSPQGYANNTIPYAPLELYLMGLIAAEEVPDIEVAINPVLTTREGSCATFVADEIERVTIGDIVSANGARNPANQDAQKHFTLALVVISPEPLTTSEWQFYEDAVVCMESTAPCGDAITGINQAGEFSQFVPLTFFQATGGRASLRFATLDPTSELSEERSISVGEQ